MTSCPACAVKRLHKRADWEMHPYAGHGYAQGQGWTHPAIDPQRIRELILGPSASVSVGVSWPTGRRAGDAIPQQTIGRTPEWREQLGNLPPGARRAGAGEIFLGENL